MRYIFNFMFTLPDTCSRMTCNELLVTATVMTLGLWFILTISGRKLA